jgi:hypothetical protein
MSRDGWAGGAEEAAAAPPDCVGESAPPVDPLLKAPRSVLLPRLPLPTLPPLPEGFGANSKSLVVLCIYNTTGRGEKQ